MFVSMRVTPAEKNIMQNYAATQGSTVSKVVKDAFFEHIEDQLDIEAYQNYLARKTSGDVKYHTLDEVIEECGLSGEI
jgi:predicted DNA-binding protein